MVQTGRQVTRKEYGFRKSGMSFDAIVELSDDTSTNSIRATSVPRFFGVRAMILSLT